MQDDEEEDEPAKPTTSTTVSTTGQPGVKPALSPEEVEAARKKKEAKEAAEKKIADQKAKVREERVKMLMERLRSKLALFTEQAQSEDDEQIAAGGSFESVLRRDGIELTRLLRQFGRCGPSRRKSSNRRVTASSFFTRSASFTRASRSTSPSVLPCSDIANAAH